jgi:hypothetical protein
MKMNTARIPRAISMALTLIRPPRSIIIPCVIRASGNSRLLNQKLGGRPNRAQAETFGKNRRSYGSFQRLAMSVATGKMFTRSRRKNCEPNPEGLCASDDRKGLPMFVCSRQSPCLNSSCVRADGGRLRREFSLTSQDVESRAGRSRGPRGPSWLHCTTVSTCPNREF